VVVELLNDRNWGPYLSVSDACVKEGNTGTVAAAFTVTLSAASTQPVTVAYATGNGTAASDYQAASVTLTFAPGETSKTITIEVKGDSKKEAHETFYLDLFRARQQCAFHQNRGIGTILIDD
jgi:Calx-beta domain